jgi:hypothetical protein
MPRANHIQKDNVSAFTDGLARILRRVAVIGEHSKPVLEPRSQVMQFSKLVLRQRFGWKQVKRAGVGILQHGIQNRKVVAKGFA